MQIKLLGALAAGRGLEIVQVRDRYHRRYFLLPMEGSIGERVRGARRFNTLSQVASEIGIRGTRQVTFN